MFKKILIANRGEIAVRVMRACRELDIRSVTVYSDVDREALHVRKADEAYSLGAASAAESYLNIAKILEVARRSGAEAIHPGYGFLSENAQFARECASAGVKFIGPTAQAMERMGRKIQARQTALAAGLPVVPGSREPLTEVTAAAAVAAEIGYPVMVKASAGGGGKGMRLVRSPVELPSALQAASSESARAFSDGAVYLEKVILTPRHIEVQVLGDEHGNLLHLGERECSVQRRHQKVLEESPSPAVDEAARQRMGELAVRVARTAGYTNAGTVEFLVDADRNFYFLEMNTRLQVEHPVTELVTGLDLVHLQIHIAAGERLRLSQEEVAPRGHAIECRIYAEDPDNNFFPSPGRITRLMAPSGHGIREDSGVFEGWTVPVEYDSLLAKLVAHAGTRAQAISRLRGAIDEYFIGGIRTNVPLFRRILRDSDFLAGKVDTGFLDRLLEGGQRQRGDGEIRVAAVAAALFVAQEQSVAPGVNGRSRPASGVESSRWKRIARQEAVEKTPA